VRQIVTGTDSNGRSCIAKEFNNEPSLVSETSMATIFERADCLAAPRPPGDGKFIDLGMEAGASRWLIAKSAPGAFTEMHHTDSLDFGTVLDGSIDLILGDGTHRLEAGDCVVLTGVDHGWQAGPGGCTLLILLLGTVPRDE
jgi:mannose-6-phosphate isomerase-like protein (cupin superfamily)